MVASISEVRHVDFDGHRVAGAALAATAVNTSITEWHFSGGEWHLIRYNDAAHLAPPAIACPCRSG